MSLLTDLRERTKTLHVDVEQAMDIMNPLISLDMYRQTLLIFFKFYSDLKTRLEAHPTTSPDPDFSVDRQLKRLETDLQSLELWPQILGESAQTQLPDLADNSLRLGVFYVVIGSALGGQFISRHIEKTIGITPENGGAFFHGAGEKTAQNWKDFLLRLSQFKGTPQEHENVLRAAEATFQTLLNLMQPTGLPTHASTTTSETGLRHK